MRSTSARTFARRFRRLSRDEQRDFLAVVWAARGYETSVEAGHVVIAGERRYRVEVVRRWAIRTQDADPDVVVGTHDTARARAYADRYDATFVSPADLYDLLWYGVDRDRARAIVDDHLEGSLLALPEISVPVPSITRLSRTATATVIVAAVVLLLVGGVVLFVESGGQDHLEPTEQTSDSAIEAGPVASDATDEYPPGLSADGITDASELVHTHQTRMSGLSRTNTISYEGPSTWLFMDSTRYESSLQIDAENNYLYSVNRTTTDPHRNETIVVVEDTYHVDDTTFTRSQRKNDTDVLHTSTDVQDRSPAQRATGLPHLLLEGALTANETDVEPVEAPDDAAYRVTATGESTEFQRGQFMWVTDEFETVAYFAANGRLVELTVSYVHLQTGERASIEITYSDVGAVDRIQPPEWSENATATDETSAV